MSNLYRMKPKKKGCEKSVVDTKIKYKPNTWSGVIDEPKISTEPVISKMSCKEEINGVSSNEHVGALARRRMATATYLEYAGERQNEARACAYEEDSGDVEAKRDGGVGNEDKGADACELEERRPALREGENGEVDEGADGRVVVERDEGVHLEAV